MASCQKILILCNAGHSQATRRRLKNKGIVSFLDSRYRCPLPLFASGDRLKTGPRLWRK